MEVEEEESVLCLIDELKAEDHNTRIHAINSLHIIADAIGEEKTRSELIPYMSELLEDDNEEVLLAIASKLAELSKYIGTQWYSCLLPPLSTLCSNEEPIVQEKAINTLIFISKKLSSSEKQQLFTPLILNLATNSWPNSRVSACSLFQVVISDSSAQHEEMLEIFTKLSSDESPLVRRAAAINIGYFSLQPSLRILEIFYNLLKDDNESVRQMCLESTCKVITESKDLLEIIKTSATDKSWRVRFTLLENIEGLSANIESLLQVRNELLGLLSDNETEVKCIAINKLVRIVQKLSKSFLISELIPTFDILSKDPSYFVRLSLMQAICIVSTHLDQKTSVLKLLPIINQLIRDENFEVRMSFAENMNNFNVSIGAEKVLTFSIPLIMQMMNDSRWRLRLKVVESLPQVAELIGNSQFTEQISTPMVKWVEDPVFAVRDAALESIYIIGCKFGEEWTKNHICPLIEMLVASPVFTKRMTALKAINKLAELLDYQICSRFLLILSKDRIPNIRFNVAKTINNIHNVFRLEQNLLRVLEIFKLDSDPDVKYYALQATSCINSFLCN